MNSITEEVVYGDGQLTVASLCQSSPTILIDYAVEMVSHQTQRMSTVGGILYVCTCSCVCILKSYVSFIVYDSKRL